MFQCQEPLHLNIFQVPLTTDLDMKLHKGLSTSRRRGFFVLSSTDRINHYHSIIPLLCFRFYSLSDFFMAYNFDLDTLRRYTLGTGQLGKPRD